MLSDPRAQLLFSELLFGIAFKTTWRVRKGESKRGGESQRGEGEKKKRMKRRREELEEAEEEEVLGRNTKRRGYVESSSVTEILAGATAAEEGGGEERDEAPFPPPSPTDGSAPTDGFRTCGSWAVIDIDNLRAGGIHLGKGTG